MSNTIHVVGGHRVTSLASVSRMSATRALIWKQCQDLTQSFTVLGAAGWAWLLLGAWMARDHGGESRWVLVVAGLFTCGFALVSCFVSFVTESEQRTREFLVGLPVSSFKVGLVKLLVSAAAVAVFFALQMAMVVVAVWLQSMFTTSNGPPVWDVAIEDLKNSWYLVPFWVAIVFVSCSIGCSFWSSSWMSVATAIPLIFLFAFLLSWLDRNSNLETGARNDTRFLLLLLVSTFLVMSVALPLIWLRRRPLWPMLAGSPVRNEHAEDDFFWSSLLGKLGIVTPEVLAMPGRGRFSALCWQSLRQQMMLPLMAIAGVGVMTWLFWVAFHRSGSVVGANEHLLKPMQLELVSVVMSLGSGFGWGALYRDKLNSNLRFFQQHQEHGRELLLARVIFPLFLLLVTVVLGNGMVALFTGVSEDIWLPLLSGLSAFSAMLMWSMAFRSFVYALGVGLVLALTMNGFISLWLTEAQFEYSWMVVLPFAWLITCFAYAPTWLSGRRSAGWMTWFILVSLATYAAPLWKMTRWLLGLEPL